MLQAHQIKKEPSEVQVKKKKSKDADGVSPVLKCTCKRKRSSNSGEKTLGLDGKKSRDVLIDFGLNRKKVFTLDHKKDDLHSLFTSYILGERAFSKLLQDSYVVFQSYNEKFGTWVDVDAREKIQDGTVLKAVFFPNSIERNDSNPDGIKKREEEIVKGIKCERENSVDIELTSSGSSDDENPETPSEKGTSGEEESLPPVKHKRAKEKKTKVDVKQEEFSLEETGKEGVFNKALNAEPPDLSKPSVYHVADGKSGAPLWHHPETQKEPSAQSQPKEEVQNGRFIPQRESQSPSHSRHSESTNQDSAGESSKHCDELDDHMSNSPNTGDFNMRNIRQLNVLCKKQGFSPQFRVRPAEDGSWIWTVVVKGETYSARHKRREVAKEQAAQVALLALNSWHGKQRGRGTKASQGRCRGQGRGRGRGQGYGRGQNNYQMHYWP